MPMIEIFAVTAPEMLGMGATMAEGAGALGAFGELGALGELGLGAEALGAGALGAEAFGGLGAFGEAGAGILGTGAQSIPELLQIYPELASDPNFLAELTQSQATNSGIMQAADNVGALTENNVRALNPLQQFSETRSPMAPGFDVSQNTTDVLQNVPQTSLGNESLGTQPGGLYETFNLSNANDVPNTRMDAMQARLDAKEKNSDSPLMRGLNSATDWIKDNPWKSLGAAALLGSKLGGSSDAQAPDTTYNGPLNKYKLSPDFKGRFANPQDFQYTPIQYKYASGGITGAHGYAKGGETPDWENMMSPKRAPTPTSHDVGIYRDVDPDTAYLDPLTAAMVRQSKLDKRSYVNTKAKFRKPIPMGTLNFDPVAGAAQGGIMQAQRYDTGGTTFDPMTGSTSGAKFDPATGKFVDPNLIWDPVTNKYIPKSNLTTAQQFIPGEYGGTRGGMTAAEINNPTRYVNFSDEEKASYHANNPIKSAIASGLDSLSGMKRLNKLINPEYAAKEEMIRQGLSPRSGLSYITPPASTTASGAPYTPSSPAVQFNVNQPGMFDGMDSGGARASNISSSIAQRESDANNANNARGGEPGADRGDPGGDRGGWGRGGGYAHGGITSIPYNLGGYAAGGNPRLLRGPGDGMSDNIPATINNRQPARLADGEFVVPADVVSHLGNGSTEAGAKKLHEMMNKVRKARTGNQKQGKQINPNRFMPK